jgi:hypothetical protein
MKSMIRVQIRTKVKRRVRIHIEDTILKLCGFKIEPWRAVDAHTAGVETQNGAVEGLYANGCRFSTVTLNKIKKIKGDKHYNRKGRNTL